MVNYNQIVGGENSSSPEFVSNFAYSLKASSVPNKIRTNFTPLSSKYFPESRIRILTSF